MGSHATHHMDPNSVSTYHVKAKTLGDRARSIFDHLERYGPMAEEEIIRRMGFRDSNAVRPRVSEMIQAGILEEYRKEVSRITGRPVRVVGLPRPKVAPQPEQLGLL